MHDSTHFPPSTGFTPTPIPLHGTPSATPGSTPEVTDSQKTQPLEKIKNPKTKELAKKTNELSKQIANLKKELAEHVVLFGSGEINKEQAESKLGEISQTLEGLNNEIHELETQLAKAPSSRRKELETNLRMVKLEVETLEKQEISARISLNQVLGNDAKKQINILLMEGNKDPSKAVENYRRAAALLKDLDPQGGHFPDLERKLDAFANARLGLTSSERNIEKKLSKGAFADSETKVSREDALLIESVIKKKGEEIKLTPDENQKKALKDELKHLTRGLLNNKSFLSHFSSLEESPEASLTSQQYAPTKALSEMQVYLLEVASPDLGIFAETRKKADPIAVLPKPVGSLKTELTSKEQKGAFFKVGFMAYIFNREAVQIAKKLNVIALENLKMEKEIQTKLKQLEGTESINRANIQYQIQNLDSLIQDEKDALANLKAQLDTKQMTSLTMKLEKAILRQENMIERLEIKKDILINRVLSDYGSAQKYRNSMESYLKLVGGTYSSDGEVLFKAYQAQQAIQKLAETTTGPYKAEIEKLNHEAIARLDEFQKNAELTSSQKKLSEKILEGTPKDIEKLLKLDDNTSEVKKIFDKEMLSFIREKDPEKKAEILSRLAEFKARLETPVLFSGPRPTDLSKEFSLLARPAGYRSMVEFYKHAFEIQDTLQSKGDIGTAVIKLNQHFGNMEEIVQTLKSESPEEAGVPESLLARHTELSASMESYMEGIKFGKGERRASTSLERKELQRKQQEEVRNLLIKKSAVALGKNDPGSAEEVISLLGKIKESEVVLSSGEKFKSFFGRDSRSLSREEMFASISQDSSVSPLLEAMKDQAQVRIMKNLDELEKAYTTSSGDINQKRIQITEINSALSKELKIYESLNFSKDTKLVSTLSDRFQNILQSQIDRTMALPEGHLEANALEMEFAGNLIQSSISQVPASMRISLIAQMKNDPVLSTKVEGLVQRFENLFQQNPQDLKKLSIPANSINTLAAFAGVEESKLESFQAHRKDIPFILAFGELISTINAEMDAGRKGYDKLEQQKEALGSHLDKDEFAELDGFLIKYQNYLEKLEALQTLFSRHGNQLPSTESIKDTANIFGSKEFKEYMEAVEEHLKTVPGMTKIHQAASEEMAQAKKTGVQSPRVKAFEAAGLDSQFGLMSIPRQKLLLWANLVPTFTKELEKKLPNQNPQELEKLQIASKNKLADVQEKKYADPRERIQAKIQVIQESNHQIKAFWEKELDNYDKQVDQDVMNGKVAPEMAAKLKSEARGRAESREKFADNLLEIQRTIEGINLLYGS